MSKVKVIYALLLFLFFAPTKAEAQSEFIYLVKVFDCKTAPSCSRVQTGFRLRGIKGIVTALHGVADAGEIRVIGDPGAARFTGKFRVAKVDVPHDVALLTSNEIESAPADGLDVAQNVDWDALRKIYVTGRPLGLSANLETELPLRRPALKTLRDLLPPDIAVKLLDRRSPDPDEEVVSINGVLLPGHSGAPLLNSQNQFVAVGNGGLLGGPSGICWAIPWRRVQLVDAASEGRLASLSKADPNPLFSFEDENESKLPEIYRVRITVVGPQQTPVDDAKVVASTGGEALKASGGYQYEIPRAKRPQDGKVVFYGSKESAYLSGKAETTLASDPNLSVTVFLSNDKSAVVRGLVVDESNTGVVGVRVSVSGYESEAVVTKEGGGFVLPSHAAASQMVLLHVEKSGYKGAFQSHPAGDEPATIILEKQPTGSPVPEYIKKLDEIGGTGWVLLGTFNKSNPNQFSTRFFELVGNSADISKLQYGDVVRIISNEREVVIIDWRISRQHYADTPPWKKHEFDMRPEDYTGVIIPIGARVKVNRATISPPDFGEVKYFWVQISKPQNRDDWVIDTSKSK